MWPERPAFPRLPSNLPCAGGIMAKPCNIRHPHGTQPCVPSMAAWSGPATNLAPLCQDQMGEAFWPGHIFIGRPLKEFVPSPWVPPFKCFEDATFQGAYFLSYARKRSETRKWLAPLAGRTLVCICERGSFCHGWVLLKLFDECMPSVPSQGKVPVPAPR